VSGSVVYLVLCCLCALCTANGWRPFSRHGLLSIPSWLYGLPTSEFPLVVLGLQLVLTAAAAVAGMIHGPAGVLGLLITAVSWAGLVGLHVVALRADRVLCAALGTGLAAEVEPVDPELAPLGVVATARSRRRFVRDADISYGPGGRANLLDIWQDPEQRRDGRSPVLLQIAGGAWVMGNKQGQAYPLMSHLVARGWTCVSLSYRLSPRNPWPAQIVDVKRAIVWIKHNIASYGGDPRFIAVTGGSAGGHLASLAALTPGLAEFQPGFEDEDTSVAAAVPFYGAYDWTNSDGTGHNSLVGHLEKKVVQESLAAGRAAFELASPLSHVSASAPPFFVLHGAADSFIPVEQCRAFVSRLRAASVAPVVYAELPQAQHAFDVFGAPRANRAARAVGQFLAAVHAESRPRTSPT
jgi:acetyl esterase/lipase